MDTIVRLLDTLQLNRVPAALQCSGYVLSSLIQVTSEYMHMLYINALKLAFYIQRIVNKKLFTVL